METVYQSKYLTLMIEPEKELIKVVWSATTENMTDEEFRTELIRYAEIAEKYRPQKSLIDTTNFLMTIMPETQEWVNINIHQRVAATKKSSRKKVAYLISKELFPQVSIEQTMEEGNVKEIFETRYFEDEKQAIDWLDS